MSDTPKRKLPREVDYDDVGAIIGIAAELEQVEVERLSVEELYAIAAELEIPEQYVAPAVTELQDRRARLLADEAAEAETSRRRRRLALYVVGGLTLLCLVAAFIGQRGLSAHYGEVEKTRAQLINVAQRQSATVKQWADQPDGEQKSAELSGAENRVRIEAKRYNEAIAQYNDHVRTFPGRIWAALFYYPDAQPQAHELNAF